MKTLTAALGCLLVFAAAGTPGLAAPAAARTASKLTSVQVTDLTGKSVAVPDPQAKGTVLLFVSTTCPYSNGAAPEMAKIANSYSQRGFKFVFVYANTYETQSGATKHAHDYGFTQPALIDTKQQLVKATGATNTPEAVVISPSGKMLYRGRVDNRFDSVGVQRTTVTQHDLTDALDAISAGKTPPHAFERPIGCSIHVSAP